MADISISLPDGSQRTLPEGATATTLAESIGSRLAKAAVAAVVNGSEADLSNPLPAGATVSIITADSDEGRHVLRHSTAHVLAQAVTQLFPGAKFSIITSALATSCLTSCSPSGSFRLTAIERFAALYCMK